MFMSVYVCVIHPQLPLPSDCFGNRDSTSCASNTPLYNGHTCLAGVSDDYDGTEVKAKY